MTHALHDAWLKQAQLDADRGVIECRVCKEKRDLATTVTLWRNGTLVFAICERCGGGHEVLMRPSERGIEIRARLRAPLVVGAR